MDQATKVYVIDDQTSLQRALLRLMRSAGFAAQAFSSADDFLAADVDTASACIVADVQTGGSNSLGLPDELKRRGNITPIIFITAYDSAEIRERVRRLGAAGYYRKPIDDQALIDAINWAMSTAGGKRPN